MTITAEHYFKAYADHPEITDEIRANADTLLGRVDLLLDECVSMGWEPHINPATGTYISGQQNGGWRPSTCKEGAPDSSHKEGSGIDVYDHMNELDDMIDDEMLKRHGLYREHPSATVNKKIPGGWCHLTTRAPKSGRRTFYP